MASTSMSLGKHWEAYLDAQVKGGAFKTKAEVVRDALRQHEANEKSRAALGRFIAQGEESGYTEWDAEGFAQRDKSLAPVQDVDDPARQTFAAKHET